MSRPRKPFGANHPGRLPATMMKVLAAEMSDPSRLRRGKQYAKDGSVLDIVIDPGTVTCEIQGSRSTPYIAVVAVTPGNGMPLRRDVRYTCTCPDNDNWDDYACKHVVATMFTLSDEFLLEPELLDLWRGRPFGDLADEEFVYLEVRRLEDLRLSAEGLAYEAEIEDGSVAEAVAALRSAVVEHPYHERLWYLLTEGLAREGRRAEALKAFARYTAIVAEAGMQPDGRMEALAEAIRTGDAAVYSDLDDPMR